MATSSSVNKMEMQNEPFTCSFQIYNFTQVSSLMKEEEQITCGPYYSPSNRLAVEFQVYPQVPLLSAEEEGIDGIYIAVKAVVAKKSSKPMNMWLTIKSVDVKDGQKVTTVMLNSSFKITNESYTMDPQFLIEELKSNDGLLDITVNMRVFWVDDELSKNSQDGMVGNSVSVLKTQGNFKSLFNSDKFSDVKIQVGDQTFPAHRNILWLNCPYFMELFDTTKEDDQPANAEEQPAVKTITIDGLTPEIFEEALYFIYTMECPAVHEMSSDLLTAASILKMNNLKSLCEEKISKNLSVDNVCNFLVSSNTLEAEKLHEDCIAFINEHLDDVRSTVGWKSVRNEHPQIGLEILEAKVFGEQK